ncbi:MAG: PDZ domain-containing protein [Ruminococcaceae bacterium]|nr:PDZ domain-containing protein [Oscillospiraceae bacterium]
MSDNRDFDIIEEPQEEDIIVEEEAVEEDVIVEEEILYGEEEEKAEAKSEPSEFERELENYLPTADNTTKVKQPAPSWVFSAIASAVVCVAFLVVYSILIMPNLRPRTVISYSNNQASQESGEELPANPIANTAKSVVSINGTTSYHSFFGISSSKSTCSGVVLSEDGYILTTASIIGQDGLTVTIDDKEYEAVVTGSDASRDLAVIKIEKTDLTPAVLGDSATVQMGDSVIALGNVLGEKMGTSATRGIICGINTDVILDGRTFNLLQTDAETSDGNAGGPLVNPNGEVIGMVTYAVTSENSEISFAIPSNDIKKVAESLITTGEVPQGLIIGITGNDTEHGVVVTEVVEDSPAEKAGIKADDLILRVDGTVVKSISDINKIKEQHVKGDKLKISLYREGEEMDFEVTLE